MFRARLFTISALFLLGVATVSLVLLRHNVEFRTSELLGLGEGSKESSGEERPHPKYKPTPTFVPPPIKDPFPALATSTPPPIPSYNVPEKDVWKRYGLEIAPPLLIGFTRSWPMLLQTVVSYITAGKHYSSIHLAKQPGSFMRSLTLHRIHYDFESPTYMCSLRRP